MPFAALGLRAELVSAVTKLGYTTPTPIQISAIPSVLAGRDLLAAAQTGTGKTAGFVLPLLQRLAETTFEPGVRRPIRALILTPTRELAAQVEASVRAYGSYLRLSSCTIFGGVALGPQTARLRQPLDVIVATPGRLLDHLGQRNLSLSGVETLVLDEADRMLDMGFIHDIKRILTQLPPRRQNLMFSATFADGIKTLAKGLLHDPVIIEGARRNAPAEGVRHTVHPVDQGRKRALLAHLIETQDWQQVLVFTRTKHGANRLAEQLDRDGITAMAIHGNKSQGARTRALTAFKARELRVLVATDIAARGLDIAQLPQVVNFELPNVPEDYVHRIGRTARAGAQGSAVSLVSNEERSLLAGIESLLGARLARELVEGFEPGTGGHMPPEPDRPRPPHRAQPRHAAPQDRRSAPPRQGSGGAPAGGRPPARGNGGAPRPAQGRQSFAPRGRAPARGRSA